MKNLLLFISCLIFLNINVSANLTSRDVKPEDVYWKGVNLFNDENYAKALLYFNHALDQNPTDAELNYYVGMCFHYLNKPKLAGIYLSKAATDRAIRLKIMLMTRDNVEELNYYSGY